MQNVLDEVARFSDSELVARLERLLKADRALSAELLVHLGEVDARKLYCERSFSSMFDYCRSGLGMSESEAYLRLQAARVGRRFPLVVERLAAGALHLSTIKLLSPHLTEENHVGLLDRVRGMSKRQIEGLIAELAPKPDVPARLRKLPSPRASLETTAAGSTTDATPMPLTAAISSAAETPSALQAAPTAPASTFALQSPRPRARCTPLGPNRFELNLTLGQQGRDALEQLVELFRHQNPRGDLVSIVERALKELLERTIKQRFGQAKTAKARAACKPEPATPDVEVKVESADRKPRSRYIPKAVRHAVYIRDKGQCTYESPDGRRCTERGLLEMHHHNTTFARGGDATVENIRLACAAHNQFLADRDYGRAFMQQKLREAGARERSATRQATIPGMNHL